MPKKDLLSVLAARKVVLLAGILCGLVVGALWFAVAPRTYSSTVTLYVASGLDSPSTAYQGSLLSQNRVKSYEQLLQSPKLAQDVSARLGGTLTPDEVGRSVVVTSQADTALIDVTASAGSATRAADVANTFGQAFKDTVTRLEAPSVPGQLAPVSGRIALPAQPNGSPDSPQLVASLLVGALVGLALGVGGAFWRDRGDQSVTGPAELATVAGVPVLGEVSTRTDAHERPLVLRHAPLSVSAEGYRQVRTNLQFVDVDGRVNVLLVTSPSAEEGKSTTLANLALSLREGGARVLLIDADLRRPTLATLFGIDGTVGLTTVLTGRIDSDGAIQTVAGGVDVIAAGAVPPNPGELLGSQRMATLIGSVRGRYDWVLIDSPPVLPVADGLVLANLADGVVVLARNAVTGAPQLARACSALRFAGATIVGAVLTMTPARRGYLYGYTPRHAGNTGQVVIPTPAGS